MCHASSMPTRGRASGGRGASEQVRAERAKRGAGQPGRKRREPAGQNETRANRAEEMRGERARAGGGGQAVKRARHGPGYLARRAGASRRAHNHAGCATAPRREPCAATGGRSPSRRARSCSVASPRAPRTRPPARPRRGRRPARPCPGRATTCLSPPPSHAMDELTLRNAQDELAVLCGSTPHAHAGNKAHRCCRRCRAPQGAPRPRTACAQRARDRPR